MGKILIACAIALGGMLYYMHLDYEDAMAKCQVKFSYDTCFHSLNR